MEALLWPTACSAHTSCGSQSLDTIEKKPRPAAMGIVRPTVRGYKGRTQMVEAKNQCSTVFLLYDKVSTRALRLLIPTPKRSYWLTSTAFPRLCMCDVRRTHHRDRDW